MLLQMLKSLGFEVVAESDGHAKLIHPNSQATVKIFDDTKDYMLSAMHRIEIARKGGFVIYTDLLENCKLRSLLSAIVDVTDGCVTCTL